MRIETERLLLREFKPTDLDSVHEYASDPEVVKYMPFGPNTPEQSQSFLDRAIRRQEEGPRTDYELAVVLQKDNVLIGGCRLNKVSDHEAHLGYIYNRSYWGNGYATETARALIDYGFKELEVHRIYATCDPENIASRRVLEKAGLILEGKLRENMICHCEYRDSLILGMLKHEWIETC